MKKSSLFFFWIVPVLAASIAIETWTCKEKAGRRVKDCDRLNNKEEELEEDKHGGLS